MCAASDQYRASLCDVLVKMNARTDGHFTTRLIEQLERDFHEAEDAEEKMFAHCALVGVLTTMHRGRRPGSRTPRPGTRRWRLPRSRSEAI